MSCKRLGSLTKRSI